MLKRYERKLDEISAIVKQISIDGHSIIGYNDVHVSNIRTELLVYITT